MADCMADERPLTLDDLAAHLAEGCKPASDFRIGADFQQRADECQRAVINRVDEARANDVRHQAVRDHPGIVDGRA